MLDAQILSKARAELSRLNRGLRELHLEEERSKLKRSRLEADKARVQSLVDVCELAQRLHGAGDHVTIPVNGKAVTFHTEDVGGAKLFVRDKPAATSGSQTGKPADLRTNAAMILDVLEEAARCGIRQLRPREVTEAIRRNWWPTVKGPAISTVMWRMAKDGELWCDGGHYSLSKPDIKSNGAHGAAPSL